MRTQSIFFLYLKFSHFTRQTVNQNKWNLNTWRQDEMTMADPWCQKNGEFLMKNDMNTFHHLTYLSRNESLYQAREREKKKKVGGNATVSLNCFSSSRNFIAFFFSLLPNLLALPKSWNFSLNSFSRFYCLWKNPKLKFWNKRFFSQFLWSERMNFFPLNSKVRLVYTFSECNLKKKELKVHKNERVRVRLNKFSISTEQIRSWWKRILRAFSTWKNYFLLRFAIKNIFLLLSNVVSWFFRLNFKLILFFNV